MLNRSWKRNATSPQLPDSWIDLIKLYIRLFNNVLGVQKSTRLEYRDKAVLYLQIVHTSDENHAILRDPAVMEFIDIIGYIWKDGKLVEKPVY